MSHDRKELITNTQARNLQKLVDVLQDFNPDEGEGIFPSRRAIAEKMRCSVSTVRLYLNLAWDLGLVSWEHRRTKSGGMRSSLYRIHFERLRSLCDHDPLEGRLVHTWGDKKRLINTADFRLPAPADTAESTPVKDSPTPVKDSPTPVKDSPTPVKDSPLLSNDLESDLEEDLKKDLEGEAAPPPAPPFSQVLNYWNTAMVQKCRWTANRRKALHARWRDPTWRASWQQAIARARASPFLNGDNDRGWRADLEFFLRPDTVTKILEGKYDERKPPARRQNSSAARVQSRVSPRSVEPA